MTAAHYDRRLLREAPFVSENLASKAKAMRPPGSFGEFLAWFLEGWASDIPDEMHGFGVWRDYVTDGTSGGGSLLGSPRFSEPMRMLLENSPRQTVEDEQGEVYVRPMRACLARMAGRYETGESPFMARFLIAVALCGGDWSGVSEKWAIRPEVSRIYCEEALRRLYGFWKAEPPARTVREEVA